MQYGAFPLEPEAPLLEPLSVLSFVAACTQVARLCTNVPMLLHRNAVRTAKTLTPLHRNNASLASTRSASFHG